jgi:hypothetical protein
MLRNSRCVWLMLASSIVVAGCDATAALGPESIGESALTPALASFSVSPLLQDGSRTSLTVGDSLQLQLNASLAAGKAAKGPTSLAVRPTTLTVRIAPHGAYTEVSIPSTAQFDARNIADTSVSLSAAGGPKVTIAKRQDGSVMKGITGGSLRSVYYYFRTADLNPGGTAPSFANLVFEGHHTELGALLGTISGVAADEVSTSNSWSTLSPEIVTVTPTGLAVGRSPGSAVLSYGTGTRITIKVAARPTQKTAAPEPTAESIASRPASSGDFVRYDNPRVEAIVGPQIVAGAASNPWSWFDTNALAHASKLWGTNGAALKERSHGYYYDAALVQYTNYHRSGSAVALERARTLADYWYTASLLEFQRYSGLNTREAALDGLMLRAIDGKPEYWEFITSETRRHYDIWLGRRLSYPKLYFGVRDGGYALLYAARLAQVHPDASVRAEFRQKALLAARDYYARLQSADGGWYWEDDGSSTAPGGVWEQPFMVGLLLEGMIEVHEMTGDPVVAQSILKSVDHLYSRYRMTPVLNSDGTPNSYAKGASWRSVGYFNYTNGQVQGETVVAGEVKNAAGSITKHGWDTSTIREGRQRNSLVVHAFGYAYQLTKDAKYRRQGDEIFSATYGKSAGAGADPFYGLGDYRGKEYNQAYRSAGKYLAWRSL